MWLSGRRLEREIWERERGTAMLTLVMSNTHRRKTCRGCLACPERSGCALKRLPSFVMEPRKSKWKFFSLSLVPCRQASAGTSSSLSTCFHHPPHHQDPLLSITSVPAHTLVQQYSDPPIPLALSICLSICLALCVYLSVYQSRSICLCSYTVSENLHSPVRSVLKELADQDVFLQGVGTVQKSRREYGGSFLTPTSYGRALLFKSEKRKVNHDRDHSGVITEEGRRRRKGSSRVSSSSVMRMIMVMPVAHSNLQEIPLHFLSPVILSLSHATSNLCCMYTVYRYLRLFYPRSSRLEKDFKCTIEKVNI